MERTICSPAETDLLASKIRDIPDFPKKGILFKDITPLLKDEKTFRFCVDKLADHYSNKNIDYIVGVESRGFILGAPLAYKMGIGFIPIRKQGKLPYQVETVSYSLEYGEATLEIHSDAIEKGKNVIIVDDLLATGGTIAAATDVVRKIGGNVAGVGFLVELSFLNGREKLSSCEITTLIAY